MLSKFRSGLGRHLAAALEHWEQEEGIRSWFMQRTIAIGGGGLRLTITISFGIISDDN